jgi:hypothetical protein
LELFYNPLIFSASNRKALDRWENPIQRVPVDAIGLLINHLPSFPETAHKKNQNQLQYTQKTRKI